MVVSMHGKAILFAWKGQPLGGGRDYVDAFESIPDAYSGIEQLASDYTHAQVTGFNQDNQMIVSDELTRIDGRWCAEAGMDYFWYYALGWDMLDIEEAQA